MTLGNLLLVGVGGFFGAITRFSVSQFINNRFTFNIPMATLIINLLGSFLLGLIFGLGLSQPLLWLFGTGYLGAFTTFSTFKLEGVQLHLNNRKKEFYIYNGITYCGGITLAYLGFMMGQF
ncbi:CrcB family protein [Niallia sp. XMNu-256]|uniref:fluoride efflux transporter FluC n=1 Tax=Niallia sp. XMNu-256 TaxID=3082444 RepID=UPI0030D106D4